jgi:hypothetical protein
VLVGVQGSDLVTLSQAGTYSSVNAGSAIAMSMADSVSGSNVTTNYSLTQPAITGSITPRALTATVAASSKVYDGSTSATPTLSITSGLVNNETVVATGSATFNAKDVLTANLVTVNSSALANGSGLASNYSLASGQTVAASITPKALIATVAAPSKVYDGNTIAAPTLSITNGLVDTETVTATGSASFNSKDVLTAHRVTVNSSALTNGINDGLASNYSLGMGQTVAAAITPKALVAMATVPDKVYNGDTLAVPTLTIASGLVGSETLVAKGVASFDNKNAGTTKLVTVDSVTLSDGSGLHANYSLAAVQQATADISPKPVTLMASAAMKVYDGGTAYTATAADLAVLSKQLGVNGDAVTAIAQTYDDKNTGGAKTVTPSVALVSDGNNGRNYSIRYAASSANTITRLSSVSWTGGADGNWFDPANWAGGAVPDLSNVAKVVAPTGVEISFGNAVVAPAQGGATNVDSIVSGGGLRIEAGMLNVGSGGLTLATWVQTGGSLSSAGQLTVTESFAQGSAGSVMVDGAINVTAKTGAMTVGNLRTNSTLTVAADLGIVQAPDTRIEADGAARFSTNSGPIQLAATGNVFKGGVTPAQADPTVVQPVVQPVIQPVMHASSLGVQWLDRPSAASGLVYAATNAAAGTNGLAVSGAAPVPSSRPEDSPIIASGLASPRPAATAVVSSDAGVASNTSTAMLPPASVAVAEAPSSNAGSSKGFAPVVGANGVSVSLEGLASSSLQGLVTAIIPAGATISGRALMVPLPVEIMPSAPGAGGAVRVTQADGSPLPAWIRYSMEEKSLVLGAVPDGAYPFHLMITIGDQKTLLQVSEAGAK